MSSYFISHYIKLFHFKSPHFTISYFTLSFIILHYFTLSPIILFPYFSVAVSRDENDYSSKLNSREHSQYGEHSSNPFGDEEDSSNPFGIEDEVENEVVATGVLGGGRGVPGTGTGTVAHTDSTATAHSK